MAKRKSQYLPEGLAKTPIKDWTSPDMVRRLPPTDDQWDAMFHDAAQPYSRPAGTPVHRKGGRVGNYCKGGKVISSKRF